ncbi:uncharacterized protein LOC123655734 isoform X1 [Melitaea cinxia]|uniref:uncharacterized protein LOC123655734 isoform X1 n=1 Tax=Melitaea cinxia TaxID=113334 RepID=UPI001E270EF8|nr:uncharacterized protein LOC123655734 isoform X1 [Melitaea cinxia]
MTRFILICVILFQLTWIYAYPKSQGVGVYSYQDSAGNRYGGTFDPQETFTPYGDPFGTPFNDIDNFMPDFFRNYDNILKLVFGSDYESQRLASYAARKAYDITYNRGGYNYNFFRFPFFAGGQFGPGDFIPNMDNSPYQSAFASASAGPGYRHQVAAINPANAGMPNIDVTSRSGGGNGDPNFVSVSSSSFASSSNVDGKVTGYRNAETVVNENGKITKYKVHN